MAGTGTAGGDARSGTTVGGRAEVAQLYAGVAPVVQELVQAWVRAPAPVIEDACQVAWSRLLVHGQRVARDGARAWLVRTAMREAVRLRRREVREVSLDALTDEDGELSELEPGPSLQEIIDRRLRLEELRSLPERQRRFLWLQGLGFSYAEMARSTGSTPRTVERQLWRAKRRLAALGVEDVAV